MAYEDNVFVNCPFDDACLRLFRALVFTLLDCGFVVRSALEYDDGSEVRIDKIRRIIGESKFGVHDISRTEPDRDSGLPRFNMPLELGILLGAKFFGDARDRVKACIILDRERYRYQVFCSDIAGQDIRSHGCDEREIVRCVRDALRTWRPDRLIPGGRRIFARYLRFLESLPAFAAKVGLDVDELTFNDLTFLATEWLKAEANSRSPSPSDAA
jgi:hypothetical protein